MPSLKSQNSLNCLASRNSSKLFYWLKGTSLFEPVGIGGAEGGGEFGENGVIVAV